VESPHWSVATGKVWRVPDFRGRALETPALVGGFGYRMLRQQIGDGHADLRCRSVQLSFGDARIRTASVRFIRPIPG
jgi:hypothetical protein